MTKNAIKKLLIKKRGHKCEDCNSASWKTLLIPLQIHHIDGNRHNHTEKNCQLLCPNCHAFTPNYCGKNKTKRISTSTKNDEIKYAIPHCQSIKEVITVVRLSTGISNYDRVRQIMTDNNLQLKARHMSIKEIENKLAQRKITRPSKEELSRLVWIHPSTTIAKMFKVSDKSIQKWCLFYGIEKPTRGFWAKNGSREGTCTPK